MSQKHDEREREQESLRHYAEVNDPDEEIRGENAFTPQARTRREGLPEGADAAMDHPEEA